MTYQNILNYDLFIFDFDGTLMDTEEYHYEAWLKAIPLYLKQYNSTENNVDNHDFDSIIFTMIDYQKYFHSIEKNSGKNLLKYKYNIDNYEEIYKIKQQNYLNLINSNKENLKFIPGVEDFIKYLKNNNKKIIIVSNTRIEFIKFYVDNFPILKEIDKIYTKECFMQIKPNPECYLKVAHEFKDLKKIGFEDSLIGYHALYQVHNITPVIVNNKEYYYKEYINNNYNKTIFIDYTHLDDLNNSLNQTDYSNLDELNNSLNQIDYSNSDNLKYYLNQIDFLLSQKKYKIEQIIKNNIVELQNNSENMAYIIDNIAIILKNMDPNNHIYLTGMGKSGYICKKSASTWQSLEINASYIDLPNLPHGDFGIFRENDTLIIISNSGDTEEILYILKYLKQNFNKKVKTISIVANQTPKLEEFSDFTYKLNPIKEADEINMTPSTSSMIFMTLLDSIGIYLKNNITKEEFKMCHPSGSLGKK